MHTTLRAIVLKASATLAFTTMYTLIKLAGDVAIGEVIFFRSALSLIPLFVFSMFTVGPRATVRTTRPLLHLVRSAAGLSSMLCIFLAVQLLPLAIMTVLGFLAPVFAVILSALLLREQVGVLRAVAVAVSLCGIVLVVAARDGFASGGGSTLTLGAALAIGGAVASAFAVVFIRQMSRSERSETIVFYFMAYGTLFGALSMLFTRSALGLAQVLLLSAAGLIGGLGQIAMTFSYRHAEASLLALLDYLAFVWASLLGFAFFGEVLGVPQLCGSAVIIVAGLLTTFDQRRRVAAAARRARGA
jgi:drug/metabolite transporter (DMT)-like permease